MGGVVYCSVCDNWSWWRDVSAVEFVSEIARPFRVASMLAKERSEFKIMCV